MRSTEAAYDSELAELLKALLEYTDPVEVLSHAYPGRTGVKYIGRYQQRSWLRPMVEAVDAGEPAERLTEMGVEDTQFLLLTSSRSTSGFPLVFFQGVSSGKRGFGTLNVTGSEPFGFADMAIVSIDWIASDANTRRRSSVTTFVREVLQAIN